MDSRKRSPVACTSGRACRSRFQAFRGLAHLEMCSTDVARTMASPRRSWLARNSSRASWKSPSARRGVRTARRSPIMFSVNASKNLSPTFRRTARARPYCSRAGVASPLLEEDVPDFVLRDPLVAAIPRRPEGGQRAAEVRERAVRLAEGQATGGAVLEVYRLVEPLTGGAGQLQCLREQGDGFRELSEALTSDRNVVQRLRLTEAIVVGAPERQRLLEELEAEPAAGGPCPSGRGRPGRGRPPRRAGRPPSARASAPARRAPGPGADRPARPERRSSGRGWRPPRGGRPLHATPRAPCRSVPWPPSTIRPTRAPGGDRPRLGGVRRRSVCRRPRWQGAVFRRRACISRIPTSDFAAGSRRDGLLRASPRPTARAALPGQPRFRPPPARLFRLTGSGQRGRRGSAPRRRGRTARKAGVFGTRGSRRVRATARRWRRARGCVGLAPTGSGLPRAKARVRARPEDFLRPVPSPSHLPPGVFLEVRVRARAQRP